MDLSSRELLLCVDEPQPDALVGGQVLLRGWVARRGGGSVEDVEVRLGDRRERVPVGAHRPDVAAALDEPSAAWCGFEGLIAADGTDAGERLRLSFSARDDRGGSAKVELPVRVVPPGWSVLEIESCRWVNERIDLEGWLLWLEGEAPFRVELFHGGDRLAESIANLSRPDVARRFPGSPPGSCRGFRLTAWRSTSCAGDDASIELRVLATDLRERTMTQSTRGTPAVSPTARSDTQAMLRTVESAVGRIRESEGREPVVLDWQSGLELASRLPGRPILEPPERTSTLPYLDGSIDFVVVDGTSSVRTEEARRVAAIATLEGGSLRWKDGARGEPAPVGTTVIVHLAPESRPVPELDAWLDRLRATIDPARATRVVIADDDPGGAASTALGRRERDREELEILSSSHAPGFARSSNRAAALASGDTVIFLSAAVTPHDGWVEALTGPLREDPDVAVVGARLLERDGRLRSAGYARLRDGREVPYGLGDVASGHPRYGFARDVPSVAPELFAVRRASFLATGGFARRAATPREAVLDLCRRLRGSGQRIGYQPHAVATVDGPGEAISDPAVTAPAQGGEPRASGWADAASGRISRWTSRRARGTESILSLPSEERPRALLCAPKMPEFDRESGSRRAFHLIELLQEAGWAVSFLAWESVKGSRYVRLLQQRGVEVYAGPDSVRAGDEYVEHVEPLVAGGSYELAIVAFWSIAEKVLPVFRELSPSTCVFVDSIDLHYLREERAARAAGAAIGASGRPAGWNERKARELRTYADADAVLTVSEAEAEAISRETQGQARTFCVPDLEDLAPAGASFHDRADLLFLGNFRHGPNLEGLEYLCREIVPLLDPGFLERFPLTVVGNGVDERVRALAASVPGSRLVGWVPSVIPYLEAARVSVISLLSGAGTKRKLVQALMLGTPSVSTSIGIEGLDLEPGRHVVVADEAESFARALEELASDPVLWNRLAREGREQIVRTHGREAVREQLLGALRAVIRRRPRRARASCG